MELIVVARALAAADTVRLTLAASDGGALPAFEPGAHLELSFAGFERRYSLTSSSRDLGRYEICVLRATPGRGGSAHLHDQLRVGDRLSGNGPFNAFPLRREARHSVFIAGGIGITPFFSMMEELERLSRPFELHYAARSPAHFLPVPDRGGRTSRYPGGVGTNRMDVGALLEPLSPDADVYVCGPQRLIEAVRAEAAAREWPARRVHFESFGARRDPADAPLAVHLAVSGTRLEVQPGTSLLDALLAAGVWAPYECRRGECASCVTEVLAGEPEHRDLCLTEEQRRHAMCTCVSWARTRELVLNL
ncbi:MAG: PDR/VanB family oxidoreductase [Vicinamibacteria bacterium]|nr:PDR/VanB family oxidoreductase [Vicinamibacteria bacterium]